VFTRIRSALGAVQLNAGVVHASPFFDGRLLRFAMSRPRLERVSARETKRLLRRAMKGLLPDEFLAPRPGRTGVTTEYMRDEMRGPARPVLDAAFERPLLEELGIIDGERLRSEWKEWLESGDGLGLGLYSFLQTDLWLRAHHGVGEPVASSVGAAPASLS
jgi:asparagine synthase (glutamine-hydrolysing)